jgi:methyl-accepting chemotaxis protein
VDAGIQQTASGGKALQQIIAMADQVGTMVAQIAAAASHQSTAMQAVNSNVTRISNLTKESSTAALQTTKACSDLSELANDLQGLVSLFKIEENNTEPNFRNAPWRRPDTGDQNRRAMSATIGR